MRRLMESFPTINPNDANQMFSGLFNQSHLPTLENISDLKYDNFPDDCYYKTPEGIESFREKFMILEYLSKIYKLKYNILNEPIEKIVRLKSILSKECEKYGNDDALVLTIKCEDNLFNIEKYIEFSSIPFSQPRNRLSRNFDSHSFIKVKLILPNINMSDIIQHTIDDQPNNSDDNGDDNDDDTSDEEVLKVKILEEFFLNKCNHNHQIMKKLRHKLYKESMNIDIFSEPLKILNENYEFLCCNTTGAVEHEYLFTNKKRQVLQWAISTTSQKNIKNFRQRETSIPSRLSLLNSLSVPTIKDFTYELEEELDGLDMRDGCGLILDKNIIDAIIKSYNDNVFTSPHSYVNKELKAINESTEKMEKMLGETHVTEPSNESNQKSKPKDLSYDLPHKISNYRPCAFQIRFRGFKGIIIYHNQEFKPANGKDVYFTKSMHKFEIGDNDNDVLNTLYIVGVSQPYRLTILTSELINLFAGLTNNRIELFNYFENLLIHERMDIKKLNGDKKNEFGGELLNLFINFYEQKRLAASRGENLSFKYSFSILASQTLSNYILSLKVPMPKSAHIYGVADFTGTLKENEVFIQLSNGNNCKFTLTGNVLITKTPALFGHDLRSFKAVECDKLNHLYDVVVFSTIGTKFIPSTIANADLDGDQFYVFWDDKLLNLVTVENAIEIPEKQSSPESKANTNEDDSNTVIESNSNNESNNESRNNVKESNMSIDEIDKLLQKSAITLSQPFKTFDYCTLNNLIELRRRFVDDLDIKWTTNEQVIEINKAITDTLDAPKHGNWRTWKSLKEVLINEIPKFPHYHTSINSKTSKSIYGELYERVLEEVLIAYIQLVLKTGEELEIDVRTSSACLQNELFIESLKLQTLFKKDNKEIEYYFEQRVKENNITCKNDILNLITILQLQQLYISKSDLPKPFKEIDSTLTEIDQFLDFKNPSIDQLMKILSQPNQDIYIKYPNLLKYCLDFKNENRLNEYFTIKAKLLLKYSNEFPTSDYYFKNIHPSLNNLLTCEMNKPNISIEAEELYEKIQVKHIDEYTEYQHITCGELLDILGWDDIKKLVNSKTNFEIVQTIDSLFGIQFEDDTNDIHYNFLYSTIFCYKRDIENNSSEVEIHFNIKSSCERAKIIEL